MSKYLTPRNISIGVVVVILLVLIFNCGHTKAATPLPTAPATGWCYDSYTVPNYNGVKACATQTAPPGVPVPDPERARAATMQFGFNSTNNYGSDGRVNGYPFTIAVTEWANVFGKGNWNTPPPVSQYPATDESPVFRWLIAHVYVSLHFHTPSASSGLKLVSTYAGESNSARGCVNNAGQPSVPAKCGQPRFDMSVSLAPGDFGATSYHVLNAVMDGQPKLRPSLGYGQTFLNGGLAYDTDYYWNMRLTDAADYWRTVIVTYHKGQMSP